MKGFASTGIDRRIQRPPEDELSSDSDREPQSPGGIPLSVNMSDSEFARLVQFTEEWTGVHLAASKRAMLIARIGSRLRRLKLSSVKAYIEYISSAAGQAEEKEHFIDAVTTHHTAFFRESEHFSVLRSTVLPSLKSHDKLRVMSAACSTGEELWSLGMTLADALGHLRFELSGIDISTQALSTAWRAIYPEPSVVSVPTALKSQWLMRSKDRSRGLVRVVPELRRLARFSQANVTDRTSLEGSFDVLFLRNVLIYFDRKNQQQILTQILEHVTLNGWLFVGQSESADGFGLAIERMGHSVYRRVA